MGLITYSLSPNQQRPLAGVFHRAIFNTGRRVSSQLVYSAPFILAYLLVDWAEEK